MDILDDVAILQLDEEFKQGLVSIRPYIERLASVEDARRCRQWLDRLHAGTERRLERNSLLIELIEHVRSGILNHPFDKPPELIWPLPAQGNTEIELPDTGFSNEHFQKNIMHENFISSPYYKEDSELDFEHKTYRRRMSEPTQMRRGSVGENELIQHSSEDVFDNNSDHIFLLQNTISSLKAQNEALMQEVLLYQKTSQRTQENLNTVNQEVVSLKGKLSELQRVNSGIEKSHNKALNEYKKSLTESLTIVTDKLKEVSDQKFDLVNIVSNLESKLNIKNLQHFQGSEKKLMKEIEELKHQLTSERKKNQNQIKNLESTIQEKDEQLKRVDLQVKRQCSQMQQEVSQIKSEVDYVTNEGQQQLKAKILSLKHNVSQLEKANKKLVTKYERRLQETKEGLENNNYKSSNLKIEGMTKLEKTVNELEKRYRKIVSDVETRAANQRKLDIQRIQELEELLSIQDGKNEDSLKQINSFEEGKDEKHQGNRRGFGQTLGK